MLLEVSTAEKFSEQLTRVEEKINGLCKSPVSTSEKTDSSPVHQLIYLSVAF